MVLMQKNEQEKQISGFNVKSVGINSKTTVFYIRKAYKQSQNNMMYNEKHRNHWKTNNGFDMKSIGTYKNTLVLFK